LLNRSFVFYFSSIRRHTRSKRDWSSDVCSSDLKRSARAQRDDWLKKDIQRVYDENHQVYGVRKVWRQLLREGIRVARCTVTRLMAVMGFADVLRGKRSALPSAGKPLPQATA